MDLFKQEYTEISKLYSQFINTDKYSDHKIVKYLDNQSDITLNNLKKLKIGFNVDKHTTNKIEDELLSLAVDYEQGGFILGFSYALFCLKELL